MRNEKGEIMAIRLRRLDDMFNAMDTSVIYGECINSFCKRQDPNVIPTYDSSGSLVTSLFAGRGITATECADHREGILCGQCKSGYSLTLYYTVRLTSKIKYSTVGCRRTGVDGPAWIVLIFTTPANLVLIFQSVFESCRLDCSTHTVRDNACRAGNVA